MLSVNYAECLKQVHYAGFRYAECRYVEWRYAKCRYAECRGAVEKPDNFSECYFFRMPGSNAINSFYALSEIS
jgi:hypothetical protein